MGKRDRAIVTGFKELLLVPEGRGKREEGRGKREEGRGKREEGRGKREEGRGKRESVVFTLSLEASAFSPSLQRKGESEINACARP